MNLHALLDQGARHDAVYDQHLSNHRPMALVALHGLGATPQRMVAFTEAYDVRLQPALPPVPWPDGQHWTTRLGQPQAWPVYRSWFKAALAQRGRQATLSGSLPTLMQGCGGAAFHGLIRSACAWHAGHDGELADALAYWACCFMPLGSALADTAASADSADSDIPALLHELRAAAGSAPSEARLIADRMLHSARGAGFAASVERLAIDAGTLRRLSALAADLYASTGNFTVLHLVTSGHAMRLLLPTLADPLPALRHYWVAYAAGVLASGIDSAAPAAAATAAPAPGWPRIIERAIASNDEHTIKMVWSCHEEMAASGNPGYHLAAARAVAA